MKELHSEGLEIRSFKRQKDWDAWLYKNHSKSPGIWIRIAKKASSDRSITYAESLETALCYGWIDGQKRSEGEASWLQKFTRRTKTSLWSKVNREKVIALTEAGAMKPAGLLEVGRAKESGRWDAAYDSPRILRCRPIFRRRSTRMQWPAPTSLRWIVSIDTYSYFEFKPREKPNFEANASPSS